MIKIITDSAADLSKEYAEANNIRVIPLHVSFGEEEYRDGVDLTGYEFFEKLIESDELPKTSQIPPYEFEEVFEEYDGDEILCITMSSKLSGTCQSANIAKDDRDSIVVIDSLNVTIGEKLLVMYAVELVKSGMKLKDIADILNNKRNDIRLVALLDTLEYLKKGGRISSAAAVFGILLQIKPVVEVKNGVVEVIGKARGSKNGNNKLREKVTEYGINFNLPFTLAYSGLSDLMLKKYIEDSSDLYPEGTSFDTCLIGSTIGTHIGPGAIAVAFFSK